MKTIRSLVQLISIAAIANSGQAGAQEFSYNGDSGPGFWSELNEADWGACAGAGASARQSPIDIERVKHDKNLQPLDLALYPTTIDIFNNGHTIEQHYGDTGSSIYFEGTSYDLSQFHFHTFSEHSVNSAQGAMEFHAVFQAPDSGPYLVVGMLFEEDKHGKGASKKGKDDNAFIQTLIDAGLPKKNGDTTETAEIINMSDALTSTKHYYTYQGSLTTPPCSETVTWVILKEAATISAAQAKSFRHILGNNFRPTQELNSRAVRGTK